MQAKCRGLLGPRVCRSHSPQALLTTLFLQQALYSLPFKFPYCEKPSFNGLPHRHFCPTEGTRWENP